MRGNHTNWSGLLLVLTAGVLAACAQMQQPPVVDKSPVPYKQATEMFLAGYTHIAEKYIEKIPIDHVFPNVCNKSYLEPYIIKNFKVNIVSHNILNKILSFCFKLLSFGILIGDDIL